MGLASPPVASAALQLPAAIKPLKKEIEMVRHKRRKETPTNSFLRPPSACEQETLCRMYKPEHSCHAVHVISMAAIPTSWIFMVHEAGGELRSLLHDSPRPVPAQLRVTKSKGPSSPVNQGEAPFQNRVPLPVLSRRGVPPIPHSNSKQHREQQ